MNQFLLFSNIGLWIAVLFILFAMFLIFRQFGEVYLRSGDAISRDGLPVGDRLPKFEAPSFHNGRTVAAKSLAGKPTMIAFISPTCAPCKELIPHWNQAIRTYGDQMNFLLIGIGKKDKFVEMLATRGLSGELILDEEGALMEQFQVRVTPFAYIIDEKGVVKGKGLSGTMDHIEGLMTLLKGDSVLLQVETNIS